MKKSTRNILIAVCAVVILVGILLLVTLVPWGGDSDTDITTSTYPTDENGEQYATDAMGNKIPSEKDKNGNILSAGIVTLADQGPLNLEKVEVQNGSGSFTVLAETQTTQATNAQGEEEEQTGTTVYTLVGFEDQQLLSGQPEAIANDASNMKTTRIIDIKGANPGNYGLDDPRATVTATFADGTVITYRVGDEAPAELGVYLQCNDDKAIYLVATDAVDSFLFSPLDLLSKEITTAGESEESSEIETMTLSGTNYPKPVTIVPNDDETNSAYYKMTTPVEQPVSVEKGSEVMGGIRGLSADAVKAVNPTDEQLQNFGLKTPAATVRAVYSDTTITLSASTPDDDGNVYLTSSDKNMIYQLSADMVPWAKYTYEDLRYEYILKPNLDFLSEIAITADGETYTFSIAKEEKEDEEGNVTQETTVKCGGKTISSAYFNTFFENLTSVQRQSNADGVQASGGAVLVVKYTYNNGKTADTVSYYNAGSRKVLVNTNGTADSVVYETYTNKMIADTPVIAQGKRVDPS